MLLRRGRAADTYLAYDFVTYSSMPFRNGASCAAPRSMRLQIRFPLAGHGRALHFGMHHFDQPDALVGRLQTLAAAHDVLALEQHFDDGGARGGRAEAVLLHGVGEFFFVERLARRFHGGQQRRFGEALGGAGFLLQRLDVEDILRFAWSLGRGRTGSSSLLSFWTLRSRTFQPTCWIAVPEVW